MPQQKHPTLAESRVVVNDLLLYWIQHGRINVVCAIWNEQLADTERLLNAFQTAQHASSAPLLM